MTWTAIARKDFRDAIRSYWLWGLSALFVVFFTVPAFFFADRIGTAAQDQGAQLTSDAFVGILAEINAFFVPVIAVVVAYAAIAGERDSGTLKLLLSLPHSRLDVVAGKAVGRGGIVVLPVLAGFAVASITFLVTPVTFNAWNYVLFAILTAGLGVIFVALAVGVSAGSRSSRRAMIGTVTAYVLFTLFWNRSTQGLVRLLSDHAGLEAGTLVRVHLFAKILNPTQAYKTLVYRLTSPAIDARVGLLGGIEGQFYKQELGGSLPPYLSDPTVVLVLAAWIVVPLVLGYLVFRDADL